MIPKIDHEKCCKCLSCVNACDQNVLDFENDEVIVSLPDDCNKCGDCVLFCPLKAIKL